MASVREQREAILRGFRKHLIDKGHDDDEWKAIAESSQIPAKYFQPLNGGSARDETCINECVSRVLGPGIWLRYECYDDDFRVQGESILEFTEPVGTRDGYAAFHGRHVAASDSDYEDWARQYAADPSKLVYHLCGCNAAECGWQKRGKKVVHIARWRLITLRDAALLDWSSAAAFEKLRVNVHHARTVVKKKIGKQAPQGKPVVEQRGPVESGPPNSEQVTASARNHGEKIREALRCGSQACWIKSAMPGWVSPLSELGCSGKMWAESGPMRPNEVVSAKDKPSARLTCSRAWLL